MSKLLNTIVKNYKLFICAVILIIGVCIVLFDRGTYSVDETMNSDSLSISCVDTVSIGGIVSCDIFLNTSSVVSKGVTVNFDVMDELEFISFSSENWDISAGNNNGLVLVNLNGVSGNTLVGTVKFRVPKYALVNSNYKIELMNIIVGDGLDTAINLDNVFDEVRIKSNINTLDNIVIEDVTLNEEFNKDVFEYTANVDTSRDKINIVVTATDESSTVSGDGEVYLHYGTNTININVRSEDSTVCVYTLDVFRPYNFSTDKYVYDNVNGYIYTSTDSEDVILSNILLPEGFNKKIEDEKLIIRYDNEQLLEFKILNVSFNNVTVIDKTIRLRENILFENFDSIINQDDDIIYKLFVGDNEVNVGNVTSGTKLKLYYGDVLLDEFDIEVLEIEFDASLVVDHNANFIKYLSAGTLVSELLEKINLVGATASIVNVDGVKKGVDEVIATGDTLITTVNDAVIDRYVLSVLGDSNGDGVVDLIDLVQIRKHIVGWINPDTGLVERKTGVYYYALDLNKDEVIDLIDLVQIRKIIVGVI